jgi:hypothetical protein
MALYLEVSIHPAVMHIQLAAHTDVNVRKKMMMGTIRTALEMCERTNSKSNSLPRLHRHQNWFDIVVNLRKPNNHLWQNIPPRTVVLN